MVPAGEETELLVGLKNDGTPRFISHLFWSFLLVVGLKNICCDITGKSNIGVMGIRASVHLPYDHKLLVQNLTMLVSCFAL